MANTQIDPNVHARIRAAHHGMPGIPNSEPVAAPDVWLRLGKRARGIGSPEDRGVTVGERATAVRTREGAVAAREAAITLREKAVGVREEAARAMLGLEQLMREGRREIARRSERGTRFR